MSVKSEIWISAYRRKCEAEAMPCVIVRKGAPEAGIIYVHIRVDDETNWLMGPPVGPVHDESGDRQFEEIFEQAVSQDKVDEYLSRQAGYDPDIWVIEVEDKHGLGLLRKSDHGEIKATNFP